MIHLLEEFIDYVGSHDDVEFTTLSTVAEKYNEDPSVYESEGEFV
nr:hypothetical protein [Haloprofundus halobius]